MSGGNTVLLFGRMGVSLAIILGMIWLAAKVVRRKGVVRTGDTTSLEVVGRRSVGRRSNLLVVKAGERTLLVGCTDAQVSLVADLTPGAAHGVTAGGAVDVTAVDAVSRDASTPAVADEQVVDLARPARTPSSALPRLPRPGLGREAGTAGERVNVLDSIRDLTVRRT